MLFAIVFVVAVGVAVTVITPQVLKWDKDETAKGGPFPEILTDCDVFVNCILLQVGCVIISVGSVTR